MGRDSTISASPTVSMEVSMNRGRQHKPQYSMALFHGHCPKKDLHHFYIMVLL